VVMSKKSHVVVILNLNDVLPFPLSFFVFFFFLKPCVVFSVDVVRNSKRLHPSIQPLLCSVFQTDL
jgi:hypothetical protein